MTNELQLAVGVVVVVVAVVVVICSNVIVVLVVIVGHMDNYNTYIIIPTNTI